MKAQEALQLARKSGIHLAVVGNDILLEADFEPEPHILASLKSNKAQILKLLISSTAEWDGQDWQAFFDERAAVAEHCGGLSREQVEIRAIECCIVEWQNRNPEPSRPGRCVWCNEPDQKGHAVIPFGTTDHGQTWLHPQCWTTWRDERRIKARSALAALGLNVGTSKFPNDFGKIGGS